MMAKSNNSELKQLLQKILAWFDSGQSVQAEIGALKLLDRWPDCVPALVIVAQCASDRDDAARAATFWGRASQAAPDDEELLFRWCVALAEQDNLPAADQALMARYRASGQLGAECLLMLGHVKQLSGQRLLALKAWFQAVNLAQGQGRWLNQETTPPQLLDSVLSAMRSLAEGRQRLLQDSLQSVREQAGTAALHRIDRAVANYLGQTRDGPTDARQRPKFLYIPGLPDAPYHDPYLQSWAARLAEGYDVMREEALGLLSGDGNFESFLTFGPNANRSEYVSGQGPRPAWDAYFFYRHGQRYDEHHAACPGTSAVLESIELCRIRGQAPEACFSLLAAGSHIMPHHGVTNSRLVMHLPLKVPPDCALNVIGAGEHHWREGELMMFDDSFQHEAWNRSSEPRLILLMDCWNPHLTEAEQHAVRHLVECISDFEQAI